MPTIRERTIRRRQERFKTAVKVNGLPQESKVVTGLAWLLVLGSIFLYAPVRTHDFLNYDDDDYVLRNPHVTAGITWESVKWSLTSFDQANWHPMTWFSHALDCQLFGLDPGSQHTTNLLIHTCNVLLLFLLLREATRSSGRSFLVAALFACHPFNVQSVAWIAERKSLLCMFFSLLTFGAYGWYVRQPNMKRFTVVVCFFILALSSKPMAVTIPFLLLVVDYWPLPRLGKRNEVSTECSIPQTTVQRIVLEKWPLFVLSVVSCAITVWAQKVGGALRPLQAFSGGERVKNALCSYVVYLWKTFWPSGFAVYYPHPVAPIPWWQATLAALFLCVVSFAIWRQRKIRPYLLGGWLWFLGTLVPVIGIVQVGDQAMADRYMYLPLLGIFVIATWGGAEICDKLRMDNVLRWSAAVILLIALSYETAQQLMYWKNSVTLWSHSLQVTSGNIQVEKQLANALVRQGNTEDLLPHLMKITQRDPGDVTTHLNLGSYYASQGQVTQATAEFKAVIALTDGGNLSVYDGKLRSSAYLNLGVADAVLTDYPNALLCFREANKLDRLMVSQMIDNISQSLALSGAPANAIELSLMFRSLDKEVEARSILQGELQSNPDSPASRDLLSYLDSIRQ